MSPRSNADMASEGCPSYRHPSNDRPLLKRPSLDADLLKNYRPVSNLPFVSKVLERVVASRLKAHMDINGLHDPFQLAYKAAHGTETALLKVQNDILRTVGTGRVAVLMLLDLSTAFETIDHAILLERLRTLLGIGGMAHAWFASYLTGHTQRVRIGEAWSPALLRSPGLGPWSTALSDIPTPSAPPHFALSK